MVLSTLDTLRYDSGDSESSREKRKAFKAQLRRSPDLTGDPAEASRPRSAESGPLEQVKWLRVIVE